MRYKICIAILLTSLMFSCEDPIDVTLAEADPLLVVDGWIDNRPGTQEIKLTSSQPFFDNIPATGITEASVTVERSDGVIFEFPHTSNGTYSIDIPENESIGQVGDTFTLNIEIGENQYDAVTTMGRSAPIDSIRQEFRDDQIFSDDGIYCELISRDPAGVGDTYWIQTYKNGQFLNRPSEINIAYDAGFDSGGELDGFIFITPIRELINELDDNLIPQPYVPGDVLRVEVHSMSEGNFFFVETLRDQLINSQAGIFAEPLANTQGIINHVNGDDTVLGTFNVAEVSEIVYTVQ